MKNNEKVKTQKLNKTARILLWVVFAVYCAGLLWMLYFSRDYRHGYSFSEYISAFSNFIPFHTIFHYLRIAFLGSLEFIWLCIWNLMGNLVMLFPLGILLPCLFRRLDRLWKVVIVVTVTVILIELAQLIFRVGVVDIDDLILNLSGAMIGYAVLKIPPLARVLRKTDLLPPRRFSKREQRRAARKAEKSEEKREERQCSLK